MLAAAGLPLYIHLPRFASVELGIGLGALGSILLVLRLVDLVQDPILGWMVDRWPHAQTLFAALAALGLMLGFPLLFSMTAATASLPRLALTLILLFTAYSLGMILLYGRSTTLARRQNTQELVTVAAYREAGLLIGVVCAASAPAALSALGAAGAGYPAFGWVLATLALLAAALSHPIWRRPVQPAQQMTLHGLGQSGAFKLLGLALLNSLPVAVTATLFLFFVEDQLRLGGWAGPLLVLFFASAGLSVPLWTWLSRRIGVRETLLWSMPLAILSFLGAAALHPGQALEFSLICVTSGAALGADMVLLPALFSIVLSRAGLQASLAFGLWSFAGKLGLSLAAFGVLPLLAVYGFEPATANDARALGALTAAYCVLPCLLKLGAWAMVWALPKEIPAP